MIIPRSPPQKKINVCSNKLTITQLNRTISQLSVPPVPTPAPPTHWPVWRHVTIALRTARIGNKSVPKIILDDTMNFFRKLQSAFFVISNHNSFRVLFDKSSSIFFIWKNILIFYHRKWPAQGTGTVSLYRRTFVPYSFFVPLVLYTLTVNPRLKAKVMSFLAEKARKLKVGGKPVGECLHPVTHARTHVQTPSLFNSRLKPSFSANHFHCSLPFLL